MKPILFYLLQMIIVSGILYAYYHIALRNKKFHQYNRYYILCAILLSLFLPALNIPIYFSPEKKELVDTFSYYTSVEVNDTVISISKGNESFGIVNLLMLSYVFICIFLYIRIHRTFLRIRNIINTHEEVRIEKIRFVNTNEPGTPFSFFNWLFWDQNLDLHTDQGQQIFRHELFHIKQKHSIDIVFIEIVNTLFWINPFFHLMKKEIQAIHEFLADKQAIKGSTQWDYAELLLMQVFNTRNRLVNPFFHNQIKRRIAMITTTHKTSFQYLRKLMVLPLIAVLAILFAFSYNTKQSKLMIDPPQTDTIPKVKSNEKLNKPAPVIQKQKFTTVIDEEGNKLILSDSSVVLLVINGEKKGRSSDFLILNKWITPADITSINVLKDKSATDKYGDEGKNGVIEIITKDNSLIEVPLEERRIAKNISPTEFFEVIEDKKIETVAPIESNDVEVVLTEKRIDTVPGSDKNLEVVERPIFEIAEVPPAFKGGDKAWTAHINAFLSKQSPIECDPKNNTATIRFVVETNGEISMVELLTTRSEFAKLCMQAIRESSGKWESAIQNGHKVPATRKFTFNCADPTKSPQVIRKDGTPITKKIPTNSQLNDWQDKKLYGVWIDGKRINNTELKKYKASDFAWYLVSKLAPNTVNYEKHVNQVNLSTNSFFETWSSRSVNK